MDTSHWRRDAMAFVGTAAAVLLVAAAPARGQVAVPEEVPPGVPCTPRAVIALAAPIPESEYPAGVVQLSLASDAEAALLPGGPLYGEDEPGPSWYRWEVPAPRDLASIEVEAPEHTIAYLSGQDYSAYTACPLGDAGPAVVYFQPGLYTVRLRPTVAGARPLLVNLGAGVATNAGNKSDCPAWGSREITDLHLTRRKHTAVVDSTRDAAMDSNRKIWWVESYGKDIDNVREGADTLRAAADAEEGPIEAWIIGHGQTSVQGMGDGEGYEEGKHLDNSESAALTYFVDKLKGKLGHLTLDGCCVGRDVNTLKDRHLVCMLAKRLATGSVTPRIRAYACTTSAVKPGLFRYRYAAASCHGEGVVLTKDHTDICGS